MTSIVNHKRVRKNISLKEEDLKKIDTYVKMHNETFSNFLCQAALKEIQREEELSLSEYLRKNCSKLDKKEQKEIEDLDINFDDLTGKELRLSDVL
ncbi:MAG: CopG family transcriptional regulator [Arcobacter sp.]|nr:MAG: CopG family transcriptional regulator [Arcobacter sp.]